MKSVYSWVSSFYKPLHSCPENLVAIPLFNFRTSATHFWLVSTSRLHRYTLPKIRPNLPSYRGMPCTSEIARRVWSFSRRYSNDWNMNLQPVDPLHFSKLSSLNTSLTEVSLFSATFNPRESYSECEIFFAQFGDRTTVAQLQLVLDRLPNTFSKFWPNSTSFQGMPCYSFCCSPSKIKEWSCKHFTSCRPQFKQPEYSVTRSISVHPILH